MRLIAFLSLLGLVFAAGCGDEEPQAVSTTIAPADPSHAPPPAPSFRAHNVNPAGWQPGAPLPPPEPRRPGDIMITDGTIDVAPLLPQKATIFRVRNMTDETHHLMLTGGEADVRVIVRQKDTESLQVSLREGPYELTCLVAGHHERALFQTYPPVAPAQPEPDPQPFHSFR